MNETNRELDGHVALVTGASGRIGAETSRALAARGAAIVAHGRRHEPLLAALAAELERIERHLSADAIAQIGHGFPLGRIGEPEDVAAAIAYLVSDESSWVTGTVLEVSGGKTL